MADKKISQLTAATTPLAGTEVLPIVQSGATVKVSIADVTAGRAVSATSITAGLGAVGTPSYTFAGNTNTGMWSPAADTIAFSEGGAEIVRITSTGLVGIGTTGPTGKLGVAVTGSRSIGSGWDASSVLIGSPGPFSGNLGFSFDTTNGATLESTAPAVASYPIRLVGSQLQFFTANTERMRIDSSGNVGIGTTSPSFQLQLSADSAAKPTSALWTITSDSRVKTETGEYTKGLDAVCALRPVTYQYNGAAGFDVDGKENISIIAQEAMQHFPECVGTFEALLNEGDEEKTELFNWNGHALIFALVNAVKELKVVNDALTIRVAQLEGK